MSNIALHVDQMLSGRLEGLFVRGIVTDTSGNLVEVQRTGVASADGQLWPKLACYASPQVDDEVLLVRVGEGWVVHNVIER
jgi:hypothetical protein